MYWGELSRVTQEPLKTDPSGTGTGSSGGAKDGALLGVIGAIAGSGLGRAAYAVTAAMVGSVRHDGISLTPVELTRVVEETLTNGQLPAATQDRSIVLAGAHTLSASPQVSAWSIAESHQGQMTTDWAPIPGREAGLLWWKKTYPTEVRFVITIDKAYRTEEKTTLAIVTEVRERPNDRYPWVPADPELGKESFEKLKNVLLAAIRTKVQNQQAEGAK